MTKFLSFIIFYPIKVLHQLTDTLYFGRLNNCSKCNGTLYFNNTTYSCSKLDSWGRCSGDNDVKEPKRSIPYVPYAIEKKYPFLRDVKYVVRTRALHRFREKDENGQDLIDM